MFGTDLSSLEQKSALKHIYGNYLPVHFNSYVIHDNIHNVVDPQRWFSASRFLVICKNILGNSQNIANQSW